MSSPEPGPSLVAMYVADLPANMDAGEAVYLGLDHVGSPYLVAHRTEAEALPVWTRMEEAWVHRTIPTDGLRHPRVIPLPDGGWLAVGGTARSGPNARVLDGMGAVNHRFRIGDAVEDVQVTSTGAVWVSYFDEGVYGDFGQSGLICFDLTGNITFNFGELPDLPLIDDCYALNVVSEREQWVFYYSDFPVVHIVDGKPRGVWEEAAPAGAHAFAVAAPRLLFGPGYAGGDELTLVDLTTGRRSAHAVVDSTGRELSWKARYCARGSTFLILEESRMRLYAIDLAALNI